mmetsp:Transcript_15029/g.33594  ORF Transcript_15029/g.33594 Transcript_15029/m.33594 type:complete len:479 (+) Transcript_15029:220-1656(+)|eukprot:CAMPEP_0178525518 /NCGR_PEP_ID=MMETSP0696-20121128/30224_1 /TAXON_ID=265572 /ORGANISM="Extubocellulus spinifer, Strain CCMP396" /LENGTH=478 /DNA_ID=CAMNT_0020156935 /DNA_START=82 /DNA_END=1518 /DNA_ORIENTATION=+
MKLSLQAVVALGIFPSSSATFSYWLPPLDKVGFDCQYKQIKIGEEGSYACIELGTGICRDNGGAFGKWWFGVETTTAECILPDGTAQTITDSFPVLVDPSTMEYPVTGTTYDDNGVRCGRDCNYAGTTHVCIIENTEDDPHKFSKERPTMFFYNEKTQQFLYQLVCDGIGEEGKIPQLKMVNNKEYASATYINYPVDIVKFKKGPTPNPDDSNELWKMFVDWDGINPQTGVGQLAAFTSVAHSKFCTEYVSPTSKQCWEAGVDCDDVTTSQELPYTACPGSTCGAFHDISMDGNVFELEDDDDEEVSLGGTFSFYGIDYENVFVSSNGFLSFGNGNGSCPDCDENNPDPFPNTDTPNNVIAPLWTDLNPSPFDDDGGGSVTYKYVMNMPDKFITQWTEVPEYDENDNINTFQVALYFDSGCIEYKYLQVLTEDDLNVGVENNDGTVGLDIPTASILDGSTTCVRLCYDGNNYAVVDEQ